jgi:adenosylcobalamin-dependent ribonucleoside-triphosphate reductase
MWPATARVIAQNRRIGVSLTGMQDYFLYKYGHYAVKGFEIDPETGKEDITKPIFHQEIVDELDSWYKHVKAVNVEHAELLGANPAIKDTTVKPSGTVAKLPGVSSGIHWHYSPYILQRIRFHETDPNLKVIEAAGLPIERAAKEPNTMIAEFPVKNANAEHPDFLGAGDVPLEVQFANQYLFAYAWADNAVSATLTFKYDETDKIEPLLKAYNNKIKSTSLLPYSGHGYVQAPWEPISKEEYERRVAEMKMTIEEAYALIPLEFEAEEEILDSDCASGACPAK